MFISLDALWISAAKAYCFAHPLETLEISYYLSHYEMLNKTGDKRGGRLYGFVEDGEISALALFNTKGIMYISNHSEKLYEKVDFLKTIHREKPLLIRGTYKQVDKVFYFLQRALKEFVFKPTTLMIYEKPNAPLYKACSLKDAKSINWQVHSSFLIEVEQAFRNQPMIINNLRHKLLKSIDIEFYHVYFEGSKVAGQVIGEFSTWAYGMIGGLYVRPKARRSGIANTLTCSAIKTYVERGLKPALYVANDNESALALYKKIGFKENIQMMDMFLTL